VLKLIGIFGVASFFVSYAKHGDIQNTSLTPDKMLNNVMY